ncbi:MAG: hypothetical protein AAFQ68_25315, partial [Bacteroidota bacterium]
MMAPASTLRILLLLCGIAPLGLLAQLPFQREVVGAESIEVRSVSSAPNGAVVLGGSFRDNTSNGKGFLMRVDPCGNLEWMRTYAFGNGLIIHHAIVTLDGGYLMTGEISNGATAEDLIVIKTNGLGTILWHQTFQGGGAEVGYAVTEVRSNGLPLSYLVSGETNSYGEGEKDILLMSLNLTGGINWQRQYGGAQNESGVRILFDGIGNILCAGTTNSFGSVNDFN